MNIENTYNDDELLSAYLDGELTEEERAEVNERLANDPAAKKTLAALHGISARVQSLPQEPLGRDLKQQVLEQIQKKPSAILPQHDIYPETTSGQRRGLIWAGLAIAAALMLMFLANPDREQRDPVAVADEKGAAEKSIAETQSGEVGRKDDAAGNEFAIDQEKVEGSAEREGGEGFGLAEVPDALAELPSGEVADGVARSRALPAEGKTVVPSEEAADSRRSLEEPKSDRLVSRPSSATASVAQELAETSPEPAASDAFGLGMSERRDSLVVADSQTYEIAYEGMPEETVRRFSEVLSQQGVVLRKTSLEERERLELDLLLSEKHRQIELDSWEETTRERKSPRLSQSGRAAPNRAAEESLLELDQERSESGKAQAADGSEPATQEAVLVEATSEQIDRVLAAWKIVDKQERAQSLARSRSYGTQRYGDSPRGVSGGEFGGGGGGYGGRPTQDESQETTDQQTSWAMRFSVKSLPEPERNKSLASSPAKPEIESSAKRKRENKNRRIRVLFYFRPTEAK